MNIEQTKQWTIKVVLAFLFCEGTGKQQSKQGETLSRWQNPTLK